ncbi:unnamed protein product, partial [Scytosiphon promiscuus]
MPGHEADRRNILRNAGDMIFNLVCDRATPEQWAEWLRVPLEHAAGTADYDLVAKLLKAGANGNAGWRGCYAKTLLYAGAEGGNEHVVAALVRSGHGKDLDIACGPVRRTPLHCAAVGGKTSAAQVLMLAGADVNVLDARKDSPLHLAIHGGHEALAKDLLLSGANPSIAGSKGGRPLDIAAHCGCAETVLNLLRKGADRDSLDIYGVAPLHRAVHGKHIAMIQVLLAGGANANLPRWKHGETPLHTATRCNSHAAMLALLELGANVNAKDDQGRTALYIACETVAPDAADLLLRRGADETAVANTGFTPRSRISAIGAVATDVRPRLQRLSRLLTGAPQDRAWRRRGFLAMCRAY